jgi:hypothetical protein
MENRVWNMMKTWLGLHGIDTTNWHGIRFVKDWWMEMIYKRGETRKALASLAMLVS